MLHVDCLYNYYYEYFLYFIVTQILLNQHVNCFNYYYYIFLYCIVTQILLNQHVNCFNYWLLHLSWLYCDTDSSKSAWKLLWLLLYFFLYCIVTQILLNQHVNCFNYWLLHFSWLYCLTDSTTFIQSAHRCRMGKFWRVLVIYTSWVTLS